MCPSGELLGNVRRDAEFAPALRDGGPVGRLFPALRFASRWAKFVLSIPGESWVRFVVFHPFSCVGPTGETSGQDCGIPCAIIGIFRLRSGPAPSTKDGE